MRTRRSLAFLAFLTLASFVSTSLNPWLLATAAAKPPKKTKTEPPPAKSATGTVTLGCYVNGAEVWVDGEKVGTCPLGKPLTLTPGNHTVRVALRGYTEFNETVDVTAGDAKDLDADLIPFAGIVTIQANVSGATVAIDGKVTGTIPFDKDVPAGKHELVVAAPGYQPHKQTVDVIAGKPLGLTVTLLEAPTIEGSDGGIVKKWWFWTLIGLGVAGIATGTALGVIYSRPTEVESGSNYTIRF